MTTDAPTITRTSARVRSLGEAVPVMGTRNRGRNSPPAEKVEPKTTEQLRTEDEARRDAQPVVTLCGLCDFRFEGTVGEAREASRAHRAEKHAEVKAKKTKRGNLVGWKQVDHEQRDEAMRAVMERRAFMERSGRLGEREPHEGSPSIADASASPSGLIGGPSRSPSRRPSPAQQSILDLLASGPKRLFEVASHQGAQPATVGKTLHKLSERGLVVKHGHGVYALAGAVREMAA